MSQATIVTQDTRPPADEPISRRMLLAAGSTGLVAAAELAARSALAQGVPTPGMPAVQAPVRQDWLDNTAKRSSSPSCRLSTPTTICGTA